MTDALINRILAANAGRDAERVTLKYRAMRASAFAFLRGTAHLYFDAWPVGSALDTAPLAWCCGDLHLENFGTFRGDNRLTYFDVNDFDEAALAPATCDLTRLLTSLDLAATSLGIDDDVRIGLADRFLDAYYRTLADGRPRWIERATARGMIRDLICGLKQRKRRELLERRTERRKGGQRRRLLTDGDRALPATTTQRALVEELLGAHAATQADPAFFKVIDVARRIAGTGSLGVERYVVLVEGRGSPNGNFLVDLKRANPSVLESRLPIPVAAWPSVAARVVSVERHSQAAAPALLAPLGHGDTSYVLRELQPSEDRLRLDRANGRAGRLGTVLGTMGVLTASAHLRTGGWRGAAIADEWIAFGSEQSLRSEVITHAGAAAETTRRDWAQYCDAFDRGVFATD